MREAPDQLLHFQSNQFHLHYDVQCVVNPQLNHLYVFFVISLEKTLLHSKLPTIDFREFLKYFLK